MAFINKRIKKDNTNFSDFARLAIRKELLKESK
jgi:hypothetical protein